MGTRITIIKVRKTDADNINEELQWLGSSLGLFGLRDKDSSCFRVFITLVKKARKNEALSSDEIAEYLHLSRATAIHHLAKLMEAGLVVHEKEGYILRETHLLPLIRNVQRDLEIMFKEMEEVAKEIDERLG